MSVEIRHREMDILFVTSVIFILFIFAACGRSGGETGNDDVSVSPADSSVGDFATGGSAGGGYAGEWAVPPSVNESSEPLEAMTATIMYYGGEIESDPLAEAVLPRFGLDIKLIPYPEDYGGLIGLLAAGNSPDMFMLALSPARLGQLEASGYIRNIPDEAISKLQNLSAYVSGNPIAEANSQIYGKNLYIPCASDRDPEYSADSARFFYRKDWAETLSLPVPSNPGELYAMASAYAAQRNPNSTDGIPLLGLAADSPSRLAALFGYDLQGWTEDGGRYVPSYFSDGMLDFLNYARRLHEEDVLTFSRDAGNLATLADAGILAARAEDPEALMKLAEPVAESLGVTLEEAVESGIGVMDLPYDANAPKTWGSVYRSEGWLAGAEASDEVLERLLALFDYSLTDEALDLRRFGLPDVTYTENENGKFMFTDPETYAAYDLNVLYPTVGFLNLITDDLSGLAESDVPSSVPYAFREAFAKGAASYYSPMPLNDAVCRWVNSPLRDGFSIDYETELYKIITGVEPVDLMFEEFKNECVQAGIEEVISEVNSLF